LDRGALASDSVAVATIKHYHFAFKKASSFSNKIEKSCLVKTYANT
jgi:hypothetical protein